MNYLKFVKFLYKKDSHQQLDIFNNYINHFPPEEWNNNFSDIIKKEQSSQEKLDCILQKILSHCWLKTDYTKMCDIISFFGKYIFDSKKIIINNYPITWENDELFIFYLLKEFLGQIQKKIVYYSDESIFDDIKSQKLNECNDNINKFKIELKNDISDKFKEEIDNLIEAEEKKKSSIILCEGNFFKLYLNNFNAFLSGIKDTYLNNFSKKKFENKEDRNTFEYFMLFITHYDFEKLYDYINYVWEYSFKNIEIEKKIEIFEDYKQKKLPKSFEMKNKNLEIITKLNKQIVIENIDDYHLESLFDHIKLYGTFNENDCIKYVKIQKIKDHLYIKKIMKEWINFNISIFNSKTIKSLYGSFFEEQDSYLLNEDELSTILENIVFFAFPTDFKGITKRTIMKIYEYGPLINLENEDISKLIYLAFLLDINEHEILGHYNIEYQIFSHQGKNKKYQSPIIDKKLSSDYAKSNTNTKSGEDIEIKLYGRVIDSFTLKEALFVLNISNYQQDYNSFKEQFKKCNEKKIIFDETFEYILQKMFNINTKNIPKSENNKYTITKFIKKYTDHNSYTIKGKHPLGFNIDGVIQDNSDFLKMLSISIKQLGD